MKKLPLITFALAALVAAPALADTDALPAPMDALGKLHFLLLHFPIAVLLAVLAVELLLHKKVPPEQRAHVTGTLLTVAALGAVATTVTGLIHASAEDWGGHTGTMLAQHRAGGIVTTLLTLGTWLAHRRRAWRKAYLPLLGVASVGVALTGHRGGDLVHGEGYLLEAFNSEKKAPGSGSGGDDHARAVTSNGDEPSDAERQRWPEVQVPERPDYVAHIKPIFDRSCVKCHGPEKRKADLRLDKSRFAMKGGETGPAIIPGNVAETLLVKVVTLPAGDEDLMPPRGKLLAISEIETLKRWVEQGAVWPEEG